MHAFWEYAVYVMETLIFIMTGLFIGDRILLNDDSTIVVADWWKMLAFYFCMIASRFIAVGVMWPLLKKTGYGLDTKQYIVLCYGGLRGSLGLILALAIGGSDLYTDRMRDIVVFYMGGMATLSLMINGTTCGSLVDYLKMIEVPLVKQKVRKRFKQDLTLSSIEIEKSLKMKKYFMYCDWDKVHEIIGLPKLQAEIKNEKALPQEGETNEIDKCEELR